MEERSAAIIDTPAATLVPSDETAPLHQQLGIATRVHRQAILYENRWRKWDATTRVYSDSHLYRESVTLAAV